MRWIALPLVAAVLFTGSGFLDALERTTIESARLADASEDAPATTAQAARDVGSLPQVAEITGQQADAFRVLADALEFSAGRVEDLNDSVAGQIEDLGDLTRDIDAIGPAISCARSRLSDLIDASDGGPAIIGTITDIVNRLAASQDRSIEHLRSINRKLLALGLAGTAAGVEPPPPPPEGEPPSVTGDASPVPCP